MEDTALTIFNFGNQRVRAMLVDGDPWFLAKDVCASLGLVNSGQVIARLDDDEKNTIIFSDGTPGNPNKTIVSEPGLYKIIGRSNKKQAKEFTRWVTHDVLPSIRKTGAFVSPGARADRPVPDQGAFNNAILASLAQTMAALAGGVNETRAIAARAVETSSEAIAASADAVAIAEKSASDAAASSARQAVAMEKMQADIADTDRERRVWLDAEFFSIKKQVSSEMKRRLGGTYGSHVSKFLHEIKPKAGVTCPVSIANLNVSHYLRLIHQAKRFADGHKIPLVLQMHIDPGMSAEG